ncbi:hypothetical protein PQO03_14460 [Lentisphaera profundi]|uniref:Cytochrome c domain-containing protein n=1 Tax=Lentisphaera profundi TaxID=1658616 RepID=A0ABY7VXP8_9BACT|nr:c-type cytochrome domain-containing protein [Lentisphaera profundi]WDE99036.1 hypothetical protein PQO03_14460 [Lentisphaera profundi]
MKKLIILTSVFVGLILPAYASSEHSKKKLTYGDDLIPLFEQNCIKCHGGPDLRRKGRIMTKGDLNLTKIASIKEVIEAGKPKDSLLYTLTVTDDEDEIMPPKGRHLSTSEAQLIYKWIAQGADFADFVYVPKEQSRYAMLIDKAKPAPEALLQELNSQGAIITRVSNQGPLLRVNLRKRNIDVKLSLLLAELAPYISDLDLSHITEEIKNLDFLNDAKNLTELNLSSSNISNEAIQSISHLPNLEKINLYNTKIDDTKYIADLAALKTINISNTKISPDQVKVLKANKPKLNINYMTLPRLEPIKAKASPALKKADKPIENKVIQAEWSIIRKDNFGSTAANALIKSSFKNYTCPKHLVKDPKIKAEDLLMAFDPQALTIVYDKLDSKKDHRLKLHLLSPGSPRNINILINGFTLEQNLDLPKNQILIKELYIKAQYIKNNQIKLELKKNSGANSVLSYSELYQSKN